MTDVELIQFKLSHYNEKARWALDYKSIPHRRTSLLPGPHTPKITKMTGRSQVPVLRLGDEIVFETVRIIDELERRYPEPALYPADAGDRARALEIQDWFDAEVGPMVRRGVFAAMIGDGRYVCGMFDSDRGLLTRTAYRATFPFVRGLMKKSMGITEEASVREAHAVTDKALQFVAHEAGPAGYLVGDRFSVADLAAAALLAPSANPPNSPMSRPEPMPAGATAWVERWADHPGVAWVRQRYLDDRPPSAEI